MNIAAKAKPDPGTVLCKAIINVKDHLSLSQAEVGDAIGLNRTSVGRLAVRGSLSPQSKTGELALLLVRIYRALYAMMGGDIGAMQHWYRTPNRHLGGTPAELVASVQGLIRVVEYLDAIRGKV